MKIRIIAAIGKNNELGNSGGLPLWKLKSDFERFKKLTTGETVVMGRKTFESLPEKFRPLPNRRNIVLTRDGNYKVAGAESFRSLEEFLETPPPPSVLHQAGPIPPQAGGEAKHVIWIIGGGEIYRQFIDKADELHITHVDGEFVADTFFPTIDETVWQRISVEKILADEKNSHTSSYIIYKKI